ncbi:MAG: hypothetical protein GWN93_05765 [Deltaproteobacteria bacterium]|nr:hypothetical protein [Deltaproteobacteria bacterium]
MSQEVFVGDVYHTAIRDGKDLYAAASEDIKPGLLCTVTSGSSVAKAGASDAPVGVAYGARQQVYRPTSKTFADGEELALLKGGFVSYFSSDFFATVPTEGATVYSAANGLMDTSGSNSVGRCERVFTRTEEVGGVGSSQTLYEVFFELTP